MNYFFNEPFQVNQSLAIGASSASTTNWSASAGPIMAIFGAIQSGFGSYYQAKSMASNLAFQADIAAINSRMAERTAQSVLRAGKDEVARTTLKYGMARSKAKTSQAHRGVAIGVGSAGDEIESIEWAKEVDKLTIDANATRQAWAVRAGGVDEANKSLLAGTMADSINPFAAAVPDLLTGATKVAGAWGRNRKLAALADALGVTI